MSHFSLLRSDEAEYANITFTTAEALPVELTSFTANYRNGNTYLAWRTATETNNYGFEIERNVDGGEWRQIGFIEGHGTTNSPKSYTFSDKDIEDGAAKIGYRLKQIDRDGTYEYSSAAFIEFDDASLQTLSNYPNPFNPTTTIRFTLAKDETVSLHVFDMAGRTVATLIDGEQLAAGAHTAAFMAESLPSGTYLYVLFTETTTISQKMILSR